MVSFPLPFFFSPPSKPARLRDVFFQTLHVVHWSLRKTDFLSVMYAGDVSETQCLVADVPLCSYCNDEVLMWESADFFWWAFKDSWYFFSVLSKTSLPSWWSPGSHWLRVKFYFSSWVYRWSFINQLSMSSQQKFWWPFFSSFSFFLSPFWTLSLLHLLLLGFSQLFFSVFQCAFLSLHERTKLTLGWI